MKSGEATSDEKEILSDDSPLTLGKSFKMQSTIPDLPLISLAAKNVGGLQGHSYQIRFGTSETGTISSTPFPPALLAPGKDLLFLVNYNVGKGKLPEGVCLVKDSMDAVRRIVTDAVEKEYPDAFFVAGQRNPFKRLLDCKVDEKGAWIVSIR